MATCGTKEGLQDHRSGGWVRLYAEGLQHAHQHPRGPEPEHNSEDYMMQLTTMLYNMCTQNPTHDYSQQLYDKYGQSLRTTSRPPLVIAGFAALVNFKFS
ncbi:hypothetical protein VPH35_096508 [Triticum aestivum]|uniref:Uncharacterized protein n=1 Tax=Aegilops tauschii TaxID=37682 RepID=R7WFP6_AEGTA